MMIGYIDNYHIIEDAAISRMHEEGPRTKAKRSGGLL